MRSRWLRLAVEFFKRANVATATTQTGTVVNTLRDRETMYLVGRVIMRLGSLLSSTRLHMSWRHLPSISLLMNWSAGIQSNLDAVGLLATWDRPPP
jgi:hypothetical protein